MSEDSRPVPTILPAPRLQPSGHSTWSPKLVDSGGRHVFFRVFSRAELAPRTPSIGPVYRGGRQGRDLSGQWIDRALAVR
ncbi:MAG: hypothetical protein RBS80_31255, partial [Thermoguttaceae bacterium]|nr:hypothetical protein [Thermoguttaceae bacterium]